VLWACPSHRTHAFGCANIYKARMLPNCMAFIKICIHKTNFDSSKRLFQKRFPREANYTSKFLQLLSVGEINKGRQVGERRQLKYLYALSIFLIHYKKPLSRITKKDMQHFIDKLSKDKIKKINNEPYSDSTKLDVKVILRTYLKWRLPNKYADLTEWFDTRLRKTTPECLTEAEIEKVYNACSTVSDKFLVSVLFDSGMRAEEFLNVRFEDIIEPTESFPYYKVDIKEEYSKTDGRTVGLYWKHSTKIIREYLSECDRQPKEPVYAKDYDAVRMFLTRLGKRVLNKRVHCHLFRKSSATYYAPKLNRQQLCIRYGWKFSSDMPDIYIKRAGIDEEEIKAKILNTNLEKLEKDNQELQTKFALMKDSSNEELQKLSKELESLKGGKGFMTLLTGLARQQQQMAEELKGLTGKKFDFVLGRGD